MSVTVNAFLTAALSEIGVAQAGDTIAGEDLDLALFVFNELLDAWNADERGLFNLVFAPYTLTPLLQPHTIGIAANAPTFAIPTPGDGGTGTLGNRPLRVVGANLILNTSTPNTNQPLNIRDDAWWLKQRVPTLTSGIPTDLYYSDDWPNGSIYLWPIPTIAYGLQLELSQALAQMALADTFTLPPGYQQALRLSTSEALVNAFTVPMPQSLPGRAQEARERVFGMNTSIVRVATADSGLRRSGGTRSNWNWRTGGLTS